MDIEQRRDQRQARRELQRSNNILRADLMHEARLAANPLKLPTLDPVSIPEFNIGCSGWYYRHWSGCFYPPDSQSKDWFPHYASQFDTVELNAPFYSWPTPATVKTWVRQAKDRNFVYTIKVCELITHIKRFEDTRGLIEDFSWIADLLGPQMGCFLYQLPPSVRYTPELLGSIVKQLKLGRRNVVEFRHKSWWNEDVYKAFKKANIIFCSCNGPKLPSELVRTADEIYVRFHGPDRWYRHDYSEGELSTWADRIRQCGAKRVWAYFNNDHDCYAPKNARQLIQLLARP